MSDQIIDAAIAAGLHDDDACRTHALVGWVFIRDSSEYPNKVIARLLTDGPTSYLMAADTLAELQGLLPPRLVRMERQPVDPPDVVEVWFRE